MVLIAVMLGLVFSAGSSYGKRFEDYRVVRVIDGDTVMMVNERDGREVRLRIWGIEAPEPGGCYAEESGSALEEMLSDKPEVEIFGYDGFGRILARMFIDDTDIGKKMVEIGAATAYDAASVHDDLKPSSEYVNELMVVEEMARERNAGIWEECVRFRANEI